MSSSSHQKLKQLPATAICGNDILSSVLYVSGIAAVYAGVFAPLVILFIGVILYLYKSIYTEAVEALPVNGGAYNCLLNATSKITASVAGVMTILSYIATAVISAKVAIEYVGSIHHVPVIPMTIGLLAVFAFLVSLGIKDSAMVALSIFIFHIVTLSLFIVLGIAFLANNGMDIFISNYQETLNIIAANGGILKTFFFAFAVSLLGISGFESSANFVEEQKKGVFRKTLRNMLVGVTFFSPIIAFLVLASLPYETVTTASDFLLAYGAEVIGGTWFKYWVAIDAFLVLSGAVLTAYVGVSGLINRMASDGCLPGNLAVKSKNGSLTRIVWVFFALCSSILVLSKGDLLSLAGVYTISFLGVMTLFAAGTLLLRKNRPTLKRTHHAPILFMVLAGLATTAGIIGNIIIEPKNFLFFLIYFVPAMLLVVIIIYQDVILRALLSFTKPFTKLHSFIYKTFDDAIDGNFIVFIRQKHRLFPALEYIYKNEIGRNIYIVVCNEGKTKEESKLYGEIENLLSALQQAGAYPTFNINLVWEEKHFSPKIVDKVSKKLEIPKNRILIGSIHSHHSFDYEDLGGVRIVF